MHNRRSAHVGCWLIAYTHCSAAYSRSPPIPPSAAVLNRISAAQNRYIDKLSKIHQPVIELRFWEGCRRLAYSQQPTFWIQLTSCELSGWAPERRSQSITLRDQGVSPRSCGTTRLRLRRVVNALRPHVTYSRAQPLGAAPCRPRALFTTWTPTTFGSRDTQMAFTAGLRVPSV